MQLTIKNISEQIQVKEKTIIEAIYNLGWVEKQGKWAVATQSGIENGAIEKYNNRYKNKYVVWNDSILNNNIFLNSLLDVENKKIQKGSEYEKFIADIYKSRGYTIAENGLMNGLKDDGIDIIAKHDKEIVFIQCKNWNQEGKWKITHNDIMIFRTRARDYVENKKIFKGYKLQARYIVSGNFIDPSAIKHIEEIQKNGKRVDYEIIEFKRELTIKIDNEKYKKLVDIAQVNNISMNQAIERLL